MRREERWDEPVYFEVSRASSGLRLQVEPGDAGVMLSVVEQFDCIEDATQLGAESVYVKPKAAVLAISSGIAGLAVAGAVAFVGGSVVDSVLARKQDDFDPEKNPDPIRRSWQQQRSMWSQLTAVGVGALGVGAQVLAGKKIIEWLNKISFEDHRPRRRELGRKVPACDRVLRSGVLRGPRLPPGGVTLNPRGPAPPDFLPREGLTLEGEPVAY